MIGLQGECIPIQERRQLLTKESKELNRCQQCFSDGPIEQLRDRSLIEIDDGIATGMTVIATLRSLREVRASRLVVAVPVADSTVIKILQGLCDQIITLTVVSHLEAVGEFYENFEQLDKAEVISMLDNAHYPINSTI